MSLEDIYITMEMAKDHMKILNEYFLSGGNMEEFFNKYNYNEYTYEDGDDEFCFSDFLIGDKKILLGKEIWFYSGDDLNDGADLQVFVTTKDNIEYLHVNYGYAPNGNSGDYGLERKKI